MGFPDLFTKVQLRVFGIAVCGEIDCMDVIFMIDAEYCHN